MRTKLFYKIVTLVFVITVFSAASYAELIKIDYKKKIGSKNEREPFIKVTTDKSQYNIGQKVKIKINNKSKQETYVWFGPCSLALEWYKNNAWEASPSSWSKCPACVNREIQQPLFLSPSITEEITWDQMVTRCEKGSTKTRSTLGRFRFTFRYAEDKPECRFGSNPLNCWLRYQNKKWYTTYSNELIIKEQGGQN